MWRFVYKHFSGSRSLHSGKKLAGWTVKETADIPEFDIKASVLKHEHGSELLHLYRPDPNATFSIGFRTVPRDSTGLPHILEHTALCGSQRYPCRDPFMNMLNRSLATFMNAMTGPDFTFYPFSSQNSQDVKNLQSVYLDAVFRPRLSQVDFRQEGWRLEHTDPHDPSSPIILKGVVYNEMKGVFSDNQNLFGEALLNSMLPSHTYGVCSGGDPVDIPCLRHDDLIQFHATHYTPANARFYVYGNLPLDEYLANIEQYLTSSGSRTPEVPPEKRWTEPRWKHIPCRFDPLAADSEKQGSITVSYLCCDIRDTDETFILNVISELLIKGPNASFYHTLVEPGIGAGLSPATGYESNTRDTFFTVGLQGVAPADFPKVEELVEKTILEVVDKGFTPERVEAVLHGIELGVKHQTANFGLSVLYAVTPLWNHDGDIINVLRIEKQISQLRDALSKDPQYLQKKVAQYFLNNTHRLILTMSPDANFELDQKKKEDALLQSKLASLTDEDRKRIYKEGLELLESQKEDNKHVLPTLKIDDIPKDIAQVPVEQREIAGVPVSFFPQPTNGVTYFRALLPTDNLPPNLQSYLPVFAYVCPRMGTKKHDFRQFDQLVSTLTGGLSVGSHLLENLEGSGYEGSISLGSHCLDRNIGPMFQLWEELLRDVELEDLNRFTTLVKAAAANSVNSVAGSGHHYAMLGASSLVCQSAAIKEQQGGLSMVSTLKDLAGGDIEAGLKHMRQLREILSTSKVRCSINALPKTDLSGLTTMLQSLGIKGSEKTFQVTSSQNVGKIGRFHVLPFDVSYTGMAISTVPYTHPDFAALRVLTRFMTSKYLHPEVREKGGAYGGGVTISTAGTVQFYSYRDPNPSNSLKVFDGCAEWLRQNAPTQGDLDEAKLGVFQQVDAPVAPGQRGTLLFLYGVTEDMLREHRQRLKTTTIEDLLRVTEKYLKNPTNIGRCVLGPGNEEIIQDASYKWTTVEA